ncbi:hypothetical protein PsorP6_009142 [Peronosclerospora sorghi]|uniref:Uncharacterized protein n=1 Tax=Peronosclerospora sorghi TaxID=230839 RepID=A0ACC0VXL3_9STRA|nr:hypothetical protein PsorP6_009142 [Peronosclerospora sorghi]
MCKGLTVWPHESKGKNTGVTLALQIDSTRTQFLIKANAARVDDLLRWQKPKDEAEPPLH